MVVAGKGRTEGEVALDDDGRPGDGVGRLSGGKADVGEGRMEEEVLEVKGGGSSVTGDPGLEPGLGCSFILVQRVGRPPTHCGRISPDNPIKPSCFGLKYNTPSMRQENTSPVPYIFQRPVFFHNTNTILLYTVDFCYNSIIGYHI